MALASVLQTMHRRISLGYADLSLLAEQLVDVSRTSAASMMVAPASNRLSIAVAISYIT